MPNGLGMLLGALSGGGQALAQEETTKKAEAQRAFENQLQLAQFNRQMEIAATQAENIKEDNARARLAAQDAQTTSAYTSARPDISADPSIGDKGQTGQAIPDALVARLRQMGRPLSGGTTILPSPAPQMAPVPLPNGLGSLPAPDTGSPATGAPEPSGGPSGPPPAPALSLPTAQLGGIDSKPFTRPATEPELTAHTTQVKTLNGLQEETANKLLANGALDRVGGDYTKLQPKEIAAIGIVYPHMATIVAPPPKAAQVEPSLEDSTGSPVMSLDQGKTWLQVGTNKPAVGPIRKAHDTTTSDANRSDKSFQYNNTQLEAVAKPLRDQIDRLGRLATTVNNPSPQSDALVAPELLTAMAGGQGSGLRMNEAEISRIVNGRNNWENIKAAVRKWQTDPNVAFQISPDQRAQIQKLLLHMNSRVQAKMSVLDGANQALIDTSDVTTQRQVVADAHKKLNMIESNAGKFMVVDPKQGLHFFDTPDDENAFRAAMSGGR